MSIFDLHAYVLADYRDSAATLATLEAREHTAQVVTPGERQRREQRFRIAARYGVLSMTNRRGISAELH
jgi:hypothetical protein